MSADVHDLTGDKTMNANTNVRLANDNLWSVRPTGGTSALVADNGASESGYRRAHAPRSDTPNNAGLTGLHFDIRSTSEWRCSATHRLRISDCACPSLRPLDRIRASYRRRIGDSPTNQVSEIRDRICSRGRAAHPSHPLPASSVDSYRRPQLAACCRPKSTQLRSKRRVVSPQTKSIPGPIPRAVHRVDFTTLQLAPTATNVSEQLPGSANDRNAHQISRNKS
jgi:hypothetical protein